MLDAWILEAAYLYYISTQLVLHHMDSNLIQVLNIFYLVWRSNSNKEREATTKLISENSSFIVLPDRLLLKIGI